MAAQTLFLIGMMGSGKSTVGARLADALDLPFFDTDALIESAERRSVQQIFEQEGEAYFREKELQLIANWPHEVGVVACGGGLPCFFNSLELLSAKGMVIYLEASPAILYKRLKGDRQRPKLKDAAAFEQLLTERAAFYHKAHLRVAADQSVEQIVADVLTAITNQ